jgi:hypothetical protein
MTARPLLPVLGLLLCACVPSVDGMARQASRAAVDEGSEALTDQDTQNSLAEASKDPKLQAATQRMTDQIAEGVLKSLDSEQAHVQIGKITKSVTESAVKELLAELGSQQTKRELVGLTSVVTDAAMKQVVGSLQTDLRPALRAMIREDIGPEVAATLGAQLQPALGQTAQTVAYHAVVGANRSLGDAWTGDDGLMAHSADVGRIGRSWLWLPLSVLGMLTLMMLAGAVMMVARARRTRAEVNRLERATLLLATAMREQKPHADTDVLVAAVQDALAQRADRSGSHRVRDDVRSSG